MPQTADVPEQLRAIRDLARRARRLAPGLSVDADRQRLLKHAEELEQQATELEQQTGIQDAAPPTMAPPVVQRQVQQQSSSSRKRGRPPPIRPPPIPRTKSPKARVCSRLSNWDTSRQHSHSYGITAALPALRGGLTSPRRGIARDSVSQTLGTTPPRGGARPQIRRRSRGEAGEAGRQADSNQLTVLDRF